MMPYNKLDTLPQAFVPSEDSKMIFEHLINKGKVKYPAVDRIIFRNDQMRVADLAVFEE